MADIAGKEYSIETALDKMQKEWEATEMLVLDYRETGTYIIKVRGLRALPPWPPCPPFQAFLSRAGGSAYGEGSGKP